MILKVALLFAAVFVQANQVLSQGQPQQQQQQQQPQPYFSYGTGNQQQYDPYSAAAANVWMDYVKKAAEVSQQLYKQWDKTGASNMFNAGMAYAQQWAAEAQKAYEQAMKTPYNVMG